MRRPSQPADFLDRRKRTSSPAASARSHLQAAGLDGAFPGRRLRPAGRARGVAAGRDVAVPSPRPSSRAVLVAPAVGPAFRRAGFPARGLAAARPVAGRRPPGTRRPRCRPSSPPRRRLRILVPARDGLPGAGDGTDDVFGLRAMWEASHSGLTRAARRPGRRRRVRAPRRRSALVHRRSVGPRSSPQARPRGRMDSKCSSSGRDELPSPLPRGVDLVQDLRRRSGRELGGSGSGADLQEGIASHLPSAERPRPMGSATPARYRPGGWRATKPAVERIVVLPARAGLARRGRVEADPGDLHEDVARVGSRSSPTCPGRARPTTSAARRRAAPRAGRRRRARTRRSRSSRSPCPATCRGRRPTCTACGRSVAGLDDLAHGLGRLERRQRDAVGERGRLRGAVAGRRPASTPVALDAELAASGLRRVGRRGPRPARARPPAAPTRRPGLDDRRRAASSAAAAARPALRTSTACPVGAAGLVAAGADRTPPPSTARRQAASRRHASASMATTAAPERGLPRRPPWSCRCGRGRGGDGRVQLALELAALAVARR